MRWVASRALTYVGRARARSRAVATDGPFDVAHLVYLNPFTDAFDLRGLARRVPLVCERARRRPPPVTGARAGRAPPPAGAVLATPGCSSCTTTSVRRRLLAEFAVDPDRVVVVPLPISVGADRATPRRRSRRRSCSSARSAATRASTCCSRAIERAAGRDRRPVRVRGPGLPGRRGRGDARPRRRTSASPSSSGTRPPTASASCTPPPTSWCCPYTTFASQSAVLQDAYAHRVPLLVSDVGALGETVRADRSGWVVAPGDVDDLAATLLARDPRRRGPRRGRGRDGRSPRRSAHRPGSERSCVRSTRRAIAAALSRVSPAARRPSGRPGPARGAAWTRPSLASWRARTFARRTVHPASAR